MQRRRATRYIAALAAAAVVPARAQPGRRPIRWVVPYAQGGGMDQMAHLLTPRMGELLGQPIVVNNLPGAATNMAAGEVIRARADGHTVFQIDNAMLAFNEHLYGKLPFDTRADFSWIGAIGASPMALVVHKDFPARDMPGFLALVRAQPGKFRHASPGNGSPHHMAMELFMDRAGLHMVHAGYPGAAPALQDLLAGQVPIMFLDLMGGLGLITSGQVRALALAASRRSPLLPDVPTMAEVGVDSAEVSAFQGLVGPAGLPRATLARLNEALHQAQADKAISQRLAALGFDIMRTTPQAFRDMAQSESARWGTIIRRLGLSLG